MSPSLNEADLGRGSSQDRELICPPHTASPLWSCTHGTMAGPPSASRTIKDFEGSDEIQEIDGIVELLVTRDNVPTVGATEN